MSINNSKEERIITVLTPTYNRGKLLVKLYESLTNQTSKRFKWVIVDDGSKDNTKKIVRKFVEENKIDIIYIYKCNGGKHTALNRGIEITETELTFIVDSDDYLPNNSIEIIIKYHERYRYTKEICGYSFLRMHSNGKINNKNFPINEKKESYIQARINAGIGGDKAEVFLTDILKKFKFPEYKNEKFVAEDLVWIKMALKYDMIHINEVVYIGDYLENGLTDNARKMKIESPLGAMKRAEMLMVKECNLKTRVKGAILYSVYAKFSNKKLKDIIKNVQYKILVGALFPISQIIYYRWSKKYEKKLS